MHSDGLFSIFPSHFPFIGTARNCLTQKSVWLVIMLTTVACVMPGLAVRFLKTDLYPTLTDKVRSLQQASRKLGPKEQNLRRVRRTSSRRSAYAFSHQQGYGELITSGKNMKVTPNTAAPSPSLSPSSPGRVHNSRSLIEGMSKRKGETPVACVSAEAYGTSGTSEGNTRTQQTVMDSNVVSNGAIQT
ncbi:probable phospholipid-transporting ATPase IM [Oncorhynchus tshawytscha]|nr:probable phospholipid-transporting ATPase IM [Oncorhynchus tshawytscha]